jgi:transposase-like protein
MGRLNRRAEDHNDRCRKYTEEFKRERVRLMESSGKPVVQLVRELGINDNNLYGRQAQTHA